MLNVFMRLFLDNWSLVIVGSTKVASVVMPRRDGGSAHNMYAFLKHTCLWDLLKHVALQNMDRFLLLHSKSSLFLNMLISQTRV